MKYSNILKAILTVIDLGGFLNACQNEDDTVFNLTPTERKAENETELEKLLIANPGFRVVYFPKDNEFGGFLFYMSFDDKGHVRMSGNVDDEIDFIEAENDVRSVSATELVFSLLNHIHKLSDNAHEGLIGTGFKGNSQFQFERVAEKRELVFW